MTDSPGAAGTSSDSDSAPTARRDAARKDPAAFARAVGEAVAEPDPPVEALEAQLDGWATSADEALSLAAVLAYAEVARVRPEWRADETRKLTAALEHPSDRVRRAAAAGLATIRVSEGGRSDP